MPLRLRSTEGMRRDLCRDSFDGLVIFDRLENGMVCGIRAEMWRLAIVKNYGTMGGLWGGGRG